jgi:hypothetical protein
MAYVRAVINTVRRCLTERNLVGRSIMTGNVKHDVCLIVQTTFLRLPDGLSLNSGFIKPYLARHTVAATYYNFLDGSETINRNGTLPRPRQRSCDHSNRAACRPPNSSPKPNSELDHASLFIPPALKPPAIPNPNLVDHLLGSDRWQYDRHLDQNYLASVL